MSLNEAQKTLTAWGKHETVPPTTRLAAALATCPASQRRPMADVAVLLRQVLRASDESRRSSSLTDSGQWVPAWLEVPTCEAIPADFDWNCYGLVVQGQFGYGTRISATPWSPAWLPTDHPGGVDAAAAAATLVRLDESTMGDPFLEQIDLTIRRYRTSGQRAAVRSALALPPGGTLVVNLPTGAGKTLVMLAAVEWERSDAMSVIVVPTVALALDHQRRYLEQHPQSPPVAYHGSLDPMAKADFRRRIIDGGQRVLITNPESLVSSLALPLKKAAEGGRLAVLAIDEAHVVASWGDAFRPQFHGLTGLRSHLLRVAVQAGHAPFKTILATATLTQDTLQLLLSLFDRPGPFLHVGAAVIRPEPDYWHSVDLDEATRNVRLLDVVRHLPRPAIVYTTLRQAVRPGTLTPHRIAQALRAQGFDRLATVDGNSSTQHRERVINGLRHTAGSPAEFDLVIATSAFGLGIDIPDIRTIIHACLPESLDRYYQEVGRGGRDGRASTSLVMATRQDADVARRFAAPRYLTADLARERWFAMLAASRDVDGLTRLPLTAVTNRLDKNSDYNERWNLLTVSLLARAGVLAWDFSFADYRPDEEYNEGDRGWLTVSIKRGDHRSDHFWKSVLEPLRADVVDRAGTGLRHLQRALDGAACTGAISAESYTITDPEDFRTTCLAACGGCAWCRSRGKSRWSSPSPTPAAIAPLGESPPPMDRWAVPGRFGRRVAIAVEEEVLSRPRRLRAVLAQLISAGRIGLVVVPDQILAATIDALPPVAGQSWPVMVDTLVDHDPLLAVGVPTLVLLPRGHEPAHWLDGSSRCLLVVVCAPSGAPVTGSAASFGDQDGCYTLADLERLL